MEKERWTKLLCFIGEKVGTKNGPKIDIAVDPLEEQILLQKLPNAFSMLAATEKEIFFAPDTYMEKIAVGSGLPKNVVDLDFSVEKIFFFSKS